MVLRPTPVVPPEVANRSQWVEEHWQQWDVCLRGWQAYPYPVPLEPVYRAFWDGVKEPPSVSDDTRQASLLERFFDLFRSERVPTSVPPEEVAPVEPELYVPHGTLIEKEIIFPSDTKNTRERFLQFLGSLQSLSQPLSLEYVATSSLITYIITYREDDDVYLNSQLSVCFPDASMREVPGYLAQIWRENEHDEDVQTAWAECALAGASSLPLGMAQDGGVTHLFSLIGALGALPEGSVAVVQVLLMPVRHLWAQE